MLPYTITRRLVNDDEFSDVRFRVEGRIVHAHRAVLAQRCQHFRCVDPLSLCLSVCVCVLFAKGLLLTFFILICTLMIVCV